MKIYHAKPEVLDRLWPLAEPWLKESHRHGNNLGEPDILDDLRQGKGSLLLLKDGPAFAWLVLTVYERGTEKVAVLDYLAGKDGLPLLDDVADLVTEFALANGCGFIELEGRKGWGRQLEKYGMAEVKRVYRKKVEYEQ